MSVPDYRVRSTAVWDLVSCTSVQGAFFGIGFTLYYMCLQLLYTNFRKNDRRRQTLSSLGFSTLILLCAGISFATNTHLKVSAYIDHNGSLQESVDSQYTWPNGPPAYQVLRFVSSMMVGILAWGIQIWRVWIIWTANPYRNIVAGIPLLIALATIALAIVDNYNILNEVTIPVSEGLALETSFLVLQTVFGILCCLLVIGRLILVRRRIVNLIGADFSESSGQYTNIVAIITESYALAVACNFANIISQVTHSATHNHVSLLFSAIADQVDMIAYLLVIYRVLSGRAWSGQTERQISTLRWHHDHDDDGLAGDGMATHAVGA